MKPVLRIKHDEDGAIYVARDNPRPEHARWIDGKVVWVKHPEGGIMEPYTGPIKKIFA